MKLREYLLTAAVLVVVLGVVPVTVPVASADSRTPEFSSDPSAVKSRLENVRRLVVTSSGAQRIRSGDNAEAQAKQAEAEQHLANAEKAYQAGNMATAQQELQKATEAMFEAIRKVGTGKDGEAKKTRDFSSKYDSVDVLLNAIQRVAKEKGGLPAVEQRAATIRQRALVAKGLADDGNVDVAKAQLDVIYEEAKIELEKLREGETLVRTLNFASDEEEYHYEIDRNDTHQMLLKVLVEDKANRPGMKKLIDKYVGKSAELRTQAESEAASGAYDRAVKSLEQSTKHLQRAIRSAGVYIPG